MTSLAPEPETLLEAVRDSLARARRYNENDMSAPAAVLWTDADGQWAPMVEQLRDLVPELLTLGDYDPSTRTGPAIWLRCVIEPGVRVVKFPVLVWPSEVAPVIYLPGVSRQALRAVEDCPDELKPLVELQYRGAVWTQRNGKDWTIRAFLASDDGGLGLDVAEDKSTLQSLQGALPRLAVTATARLRGKRLEAEDFDKLMIGDSARDLLLWLGDPDGARAKWDGATWAAFLNRCRNDYDFDPEAEGELAGGEKLGRRIGPWKAVWERFAESPSIYPGIPELLRRSKPRELFIEGDAWPDENEAKECELRSALSATGSLPASEARRVLRKLEAEHGARRSWVWARLGQCSLAVALEHLSALADRTDKALGGDSVEVMAQAYSKSGYLADDAVLRALACVQGAEDIHAVATAIRSVYTPWLDDAARHFQKLLAKEPLPAASEQGGVAYDAHECILFVDGLRFDLGQRFSAMAAARRLEVTVGWRWSALPTVTATAKPAVSPAAVKVYGDSLDADFCPLASDSDKKLTTDRLRQLLSASGFQLLGPPEVGSAKTEGARAWAEQGEFDKLGHALQGKLAWRVDEQLQLLLERAQTLLDAGWRRVHVVTDHGWLLVPGGLPKAELPKYLAESRWSRCASIKEGAKTEFPIVGWFWNPQERVALAPGAHCFVAGQEYAHGGASLQECVSPVLSLTAPQGASAAMVDVTEVNWAGLRCRVAVEPAADGLSVDLRTKPNIADSSVTGPKLLDSGGKAALFVADDSLEGMIVSLVVVDANGRVVCMKPTTVGGDATP